MNTHVELFFDIFERSACNSMRLLTSLEVRTLRDELFFLHGEITPSVESGAIAEIKCPHFKGKALLGFKNEVLTQVMSRFLMTEVTEITDDIQDGPVELLNVMIGDMKTYLNERSFQISQVIPTLIKNEKLVLTPSSGEHNRLLMFHSEAGDFFVLLTATPDSTA